MIKIRLPNHFILNDLNKQRVAWCKVHKRIANHIFITKNTEPVVCCDPNLGGITIPCNCEYIELITLI